MAAESSLLQLVQEFCKRNSLPIPLTVTGARDETTVQVWGALNEGIQDICDRYNIEELVTKASFTHADGDNYLAYDLNNPDIGWKFLIPGTLWCDTQRIRVAGPVNVKDWQTLTTMLFATNMYQYILLNKAIHIFGVPSPVADTTFSFYYQSRFGVQDSVATDTNGYTGLFITDQSVPRIPSYLMLADVNWRWKMKKDLPYAEELRVFEQMMANFVGRQEGATLYLDGPDFVGSTIGPGLFVPISAGGGNWPA